MEFNVDSAEALNISDQEISALLTEIYVTDGFTEPEEAVSIFEPSAVRKRGFLMGARDINHSTLAGMVIVAPPNSPACRLAQDDEAEMQLLGVKQEFRGFGLGKNLVSAALNHANESGYSKLILWTQETMHAAQKLYESKGFTHTKDISRNGRKFLVYEIAL